MMGRENFRKYWKAGFFLALASSFVNSLLTAFVNYVSSLPAHEWRWELVEGWTIIDIRYPVQSEWIVIIIVVAVASVIVVPWLYGRLIEVLHNEFIIEKKT